MSLPVILLLSLLCSLLSCVFVRAGMCHEFCIVTVLRRPCGWRVFSQWLHVLIAWNASAATGVCSQLYYRTYKIDKYRNPIVT